MGNKNKNTAPMRACVFDRLCEVQFASEDKESDKFKIIVYSGQVITNHWYWGNIGFDLKGMSFDKKVSPVLEEHFRSNRLGFTTKQEIIDKVIVEGKFLSNQTAQQMKGDIREGFPMQASPHLRPTVIERVADGETTKVNGHTLKGPGTVFRKSTIKEISMCVFGADDNTQSLAAAEDGEKQIQFNVVKKENETMAETETKQELTLQTFAAENPELNKQLRAEAKAEGVSKIQKLFGQFVEKFGDDPVFCIEQFKKGATLAEAEINHYNYLQGAHNAFWDAVDAQVEASRISRAAAVKYMVHKYPGLHQKMLQAQKVHLPVTPKPGEPATFDEAVEKHVKSDNSDKSEVAKKAAAIRFCVGKYPELHEKMLEAQKKSS